MLLVVIPGGEVEVVVAQFEAEFLGCGFQHAHALRHDLLADAVARDDGDAIDAVGGHGVSSSRLLCGNVSADSWEGEMPGAKPALHARRQGLNQAHEL